MENSDSNSKLKFIFLIFFLSMCLQNIDIISFSNFSFKLCHLLSLLFIPFLIKRKKICFPHIAVLGFLFYIILISIINMFNYGLNHLLLNYIFGFYLIIIIINIGQPLTKDDWVDIIKKGTIIMMVLIFLKIFMHINEVITFLSHASINGHPAFFQTYFGGGINLESTWMALLGVVFYKDKRQFIYCILSLIISIIYVSRVGILLNIILFLFFLYNKFKSINDKKSKIITIIFLISLFALFIFLLYKLGLLDYILMRLLSIGQEGDKGSSGRLNMWGYVLDAFIANPFGYGIGNALVGIQSVSPLYYSAQNVHNIYFQILLDSGFLGLSYFIGIIICFIKNEIKNVFSNPFVFFIIGYLIAGLVQFRGGDSILFFVIGIYLSNNFNIKTLKN